MPVKRLPRFGCLRLAEVPPQPAFVPPAVGTNCRCCVFPRDSQTDLLEAWGAESTLSATPSPLAGSIFRGEPGASPGESAPRWGVPCGNVTEASATSEVKVWAGPALFLGALTATRHRRDRRAQLDVYPLSVPGFSGRTPAIAATTSWVNHEVQARTVGPSSANSSRRQARSIECSRGWVAGRHQGRHRSSRPFRRCR